MGICLICLRTDKKLKVIDTRLSDFHDELCEFVLLLTLEPQYCTECEYLLRKTYNFRAKCCKANEILKNYKKSKTNKDVLYTQLPQITLGPCLERNAPVFYISECDGKAQLLNLNVEHNPTKQDHCIKIEISPLIDSENEIEVTLQTPVIAIESTDPLLNEDEIKKENVLDEEHNTNKHTDLNNLEHKPHYTSDNFERPNDTENVFDDLDNGLTKRGFLDNLKVIKCDRSDDLDIPDDASSNSGSDDLDIPDDASSNSGSDDLDIPDDASLISGSDNLDIPDDASLNSADDCDSDDFILYDKVSSRKRKKKEMLNTVVPKNKKLTKKTNPDLTKRKMPMKKPVLDMSDTSLTDDELVNDDDVIIKTTGLNLETNRNVIEDVDLGKVEIKYDTEHKKIIDNEKKIAKAERRVFCKEKLKAKLTYLFNTCEELKTEDGTVIDKQYILGAIDEEVAPRDLMEFWKLVRYKPQLSPKALTLLQIIQEKDSEYKSVFRIQYLNTKQKVLEEFEKRKTYSSYVEADFKCDLCFQALKSKKDFELHMKKHDEKAGDNVCTVCKVRTTSKNRLRKHMIMHRTVFKCKLCPLVTNYRASMLNHFKQHRGVQYKCQTCNLTYKSKSALNTHKTNRCKDSQRRVCTLCAGVFFHERGLKQHMILKHQDDSPIDESLAVKCSECSLTFVSQAVYKKHVRKSHQCNILTSSSRRQGKRVPGVKRSHGAFTCRVCNARGKSHSWLRLHFELEHPTVDMSLLYLDKTRHLCDICGKGFSSAYVLREHKASAHTNSRPFACALCPAKFCRAYYLHVHSLVHAPPARPCPRCGKKFRTDGNLYTHMRTHIGDRCFKCHICGKGFLHRTAMKAHVRGVHDNVRRVKKRGVSTVIRGINTCKEEQRNSD